MMTCLPSAEMKLVVGNRVPFAAFVLQRQELHREVDARELAARHLQVARHRRPAREDNGLEALSQLGQRYVDADVGVGPEHHALFEHDGQAAFEELLLELEFGDAVTQQPADAVGALEHSDPVPGAVQLVGDRQAGRPGTDDGDALAGAHGRRARDDPAGVERALRDRRLDGFDRDRRVVDAEHARSLARRRAEAARPLGKVVRRVQPLDRGLPAVAIDEIVPVGNEVAERAALMAKRNPAVHAPRGLPAQVGVRIREIHFAPVVQPFRDRAVRLLLPVNLDEPGRLTHERPLGPRGRSSTGQSAPG